MAQLIELSDRTGLDYLQGFVARGQNLRPLLLEIGEDLAESTKQRFASATDPDGQAWAPNSALTLARYSSLFAKKKDGSLTKRSATKLAGKKPGTGETGALKTTINYQVHGEDTVGIGSPMIYAGTFNYGAKSGEFGFGMFASRNGSFPIPWGDIPARRFLGLSAADKVNVADLIRSYMLEG
ncbi:phage virion morphogenesis protein [Diaphorobacter caeni]|uniref:phage virion morphogenesis protein n=1 Tax=Diaphorobacter caeni TaxID=2784387 RepID=UPI00188F5C56|nr:phage virion morphogenesis protein [Diaphorobacter caeni]MBF5006396.1 phage virion morphogenesis protein [Diaphorobacter caeni]